MDYVKHIIDSTAGFHLALSGVAADAPVPSCPEWTALDLAHHLTQVHDFWARVLEADLRTTEQVQQVPPPPVAESVDAQLAELATSTERLIAALESHADEEPRWTWFAGDQSVGFTRRMQAMESYQHRVDAELAAGRPVTPADPTLAEDCVQHCVEVMWAEPWAQFTPAHQVEIKATDTGRNWLLDVGESSGISPWTRTEVQAPAVRFAQDGQASARILGSAHQLACYLWGRGDQIQMDGDPAALSALEARVRMGNP